jgi:hypothetical protein
MNISDGFLPSGQARKSHKKGRRMRFSHRCLVDFPIQLESMDSLLSRSENDGNQIHHFTVMTSF